MDSILKEPVWEFVQRRVALMHASRKELELLTSFFASCNHELGQHFVISLVFLLALIHALAFNEVSFGLPPAKCLLFLSLS
jgi:hypothetical protein